MTLRFTHVDGFKDDTAYMECLDDGKTIRVTKLGQKFYHFERDYPVDVCLDLVDQGVWKTIDEYTATSIIYGGSMEEVYE